jgi:hypothetical protein
MKTNSIKINLVATLTIFCGLMALLAGYRPAQAEALLAAPACVSDQRQLVQHGAVAFGGATILGQTFVPSPAFVGKRICRVKVWIRKNLAAGGALQLHIVRPNFAPLDAPAIVAGVPMGNSIQVFDFGCNGVPLAGSPYYGLKLTAPTSPAGAYAWGGTGGNPYVKPGAGGQGWRQAGNWAPLIGGTWDFYFEVYMCNP